MGHMNDDISMGREKAGEKPCAVAVTAKSMRPQDNRKLFGFGGLGIINFIRNGPLFPPGVDEFAFPKQDFERAALQIDALTPKHPGNLFLSEFIQ
jgi:hypothetical protein